MTMNRLQNELAIVTGADSGIGRATAIAFAREGADVVVTYRSDREGAEGTAREIETAGRKAAVLRLDQRDSQQVRTLFEQVRSSMGLPTILVNNAGMNGIGKMVKDMSDEEWDDVIRTNLHGPFYCCREFVRAIEGSGRHGSIINITSVHQEIPRAGEAGYDASKGGLCNLTTTLALEVADKNINVNNIAPGMILTPMNQEAIDDAQARHRKEQSIPMKRAGQPEEIAHAAVFLASEQARYIQGATIVIDGALMLFQGQGA
jgi:glucose 1-dehydrogenase